MSGLQAFVADLLERRGAAVEVVGSRELVVLAPGHVRKAMDWPELTRLGFGAERSRDTIPIGLEGDWVDRFANLLGDEGRWGLREASPVDGIPPLSDPQRVL